MTFDEAMAVIRRCGTRTVGRAGLVVGWRFGRAVVLRQRGFIDFTPTREDMTATDWVETTGEAR